MAFIKNGREGINQIFVLGIFLMNLLSLIFGLIYLSKGEGSLIWNVYGVIFLLTLFGNILFATLEERKTGLSRVYLFLSFLFPLSAALLNTLASCLPTNYRSQSTLSAILWFALIISGGALAAESLKPDRQSKSNVGNAMISTTTTGNHATSMHGSIPQTVFIIILSAVLYFGLFLAINMLRVHKTGLIEPIISEYALFFSILFLSAGMLILKLLNRKKYTLYYNIVLVTSVIVTGACLLPFLSVPCMLKNARQNYIQAFGEQAEDFSNHTESMEGTWRTIPFSLPEYFFGIPSGDYKVKQNILFYEGMEGIDRGLKLSFDVYSPEDEEDSDAFSDGYPVLIRIHGGGWTSGDKGSYNFPQLNKYFAARGYVVFDIEYGLNNVVNWYEIVKARKSMSGDFNVDDMVRHIGIFTKYLAKHQSEYRVDLQSVFISGGSAGGQLTLAYGLAVADGGYRDIQNPGITVKGLIPYYPANGIAADLGIGGSKALADPAALVQKDSPPCLIYQGNHDGLVDPDIAEDFRRMYLKKGNKKCAVIVMPYGTHASDLYFPGYYNQVFLYYMERFMNYYR